VGIPTTPENICAFLSDAERIKCTIKHFENLAARDRIDDGSDCHIKQAAFLRCILVRFQRYPEEHYGILFAVRSLLSDPPIPSFNPPVPPVPSFEKSQLNSFPANSLNHFDKLILHPLTTKAIYFITVFSLGIVFGMVLNRYCLKNDFANGTTWLEYNADGSPILKSIISLLGSNTIPTVP